MKSLASVLFVCCVVAADIRSRRQGVGFPGFSNGLRTRREFGLSNILYGKYPNPTAGYIDIVSLRNYLALLLALTDGGAAYGNGGLLSPLLGNYRRDLLSGYSGRGLGGTFYPGSVSPGGLYPSGNLDGFLGRSGEEFNGNNLGGGYVDQQQPFDSPQGNSPFSPGTGNGPGQEFSDGRPPFGAEEGPYNDFNNGGPGPGGDEFSGQNGGGGGSFQDEQFPRDARGIPVRSYRGVDGGNSRFIDNRVTRNPLFYSNADQRAYPLSRDNRATAGNSGAVDPIIQISPQNFGQQPVLVYPNVGSQQNINNQGLRRDNVFVLAGSGGGSNRNSRGFRRALVDNNGRVILETPDNDRRVGSSAILSNSGPLRGDTGTGDIIQGSDGSSARSFRRTNRAS